MLENLLSYYPTYSILDEIVSISKCKNINILVDLKNCLQALYLKDPVHAIVESSLRSRFVDTSIFSSVLKFITFHKIYAMKRNINFNMYIFFETGRSVYHENISKKYKIRRKIDELYGLESEKREYFVSIEHKNYRLIESVCNLIPNVKVIRMENMEADFIPYYLIRNNMIDLTDSANIIYSSDHDLLQCLTLPGNNYVYFKRFNQKKIIYEGSIIKEYFKFENQYPDEYFTLAMSIKGDSGDDVDGIQGIGDKRLDSIFSDVISMIGDVNEFRENVFKNRKIFKNIPEKIGNKYLNMVVENDKLISDNMKLVDFDIISRAFDESFTTEMVDRKKKLLKILNTPNSVDFKTLTKALEMNGVVLDNELEILFNTS